MAKTHERRTERATAEEITEVERQLWEFAKRIDPPGVPEAKLRPGAFLYRVHRTWHSLGRGTGGLPSRSFRALRDELLKRDPPVRNLQPKLYGNTPLSLAEAEQLIDAMLETWHLERNRNGKWQARPLTRTEDSKPASSQDLDAIRENLLHTLFEGDDQLLLEEPVGVPPEIFLEERGSSSLALILPTKGETVAHLSPSNAYAGFSQLVGRFFQAASTRDGAPPLLIWVLRLPAIRENSEFHQAYHALALYATALTNWYLRLSRERDSARKSAEQFWHSVLSQSAFVVRGLPEWAVASCSEAEPADHQSAIDDDLADLDEDFFLPMTLPVKFASLPQVKRHQDHHYNVTVSIEPDKDVSRPLGGRPRYWLFPDRPKVDVDETADTTGLPVLDAGTSPGSDFDIAYASIYEAVAYRLNVDRSDRARTSHDTLRQMGWSLLTIKQLQRSLLIDWELSRGLS